ncbi:MAG: dihydroorotase [Candidatus Aminicenantes bacterium]|nr:dihydroorotase [Candidatus Aminicenantes bacterium]
MKILIKNGRLIDPGTKTDATLDVLIADGRIAEISAGIKTGGAPDIIDARGLVVCPGFIDMHVHLREPGQEYKETIESGSKAAVHGGFTSIACMPNTSPVNDNLSIVKQVITRAREVGLLNVFPVAAVTKNLAGKEPADMEELVKAGVVGFSDDGRCVMNAGLMRQALIKAGKLNVPVIQHPEDHTLSGDGQVNEGLVSFRLGFKGIPGISEDVITARDIILQEDTGAQLHLTHISTAGSVALIRGAKKEKIKVTADVTPHHLLLNEEAVTRTGTEYKVKPPLRTEADRLALVKGIRDGTIDCIASDHAPHAADEKDKKFEDAPFGIIGMETSFPLIYDRVVRNKIITLNRMIELFSTNPARILNLRDRGLVKPGFPADLTILDLSETFEITPDYFYSKAANCPFIGWQGQGVVAYTIVNGKVVYKRQ